MHDKSGHSMPDTDWGAEAGTKSEGLGENVNFPEATAGFQWHRPVSQGTYPNGPKPSASFPRVPG